MLYWRIGKRINEEILNGGRAEYGAQIVSAAGRQLELEFGRGFSEKSLRHMIRFSEVFPDEAIVSALRRQLSWTHFKTIIYMESFLLELGAGFSFVARQKRMTVDGDDFYLDLLFFHRGLRRLIAIELKLDKFRPDHFGQMFLYLGWLDKFERKPGEESPLGIILCSGKDDERIELLELNRSGIHVAEYLTELPPRELLREKLHAAAVDTQIRRCPFCLGIIKTVLHDDLPCVLRMCALYRPG
jgi:hypothetical protein